MSQPRSSRLGSLILPMLVPAALLLASCGAGGGSAPPDAAAPAPPTSGVFFDDTAGRLPMDHDFGQDAALADVDGDGDIDLFVPVFKGQNRLLLNDGTGTFADETAARLPADRGASVHGAMADLDGDGDPDLIVANEGSNRAYRNDGPAKPGHFTERPFPAAARLSESVATGDIDGDGDVDVVFGNLGIGTGGEQNAVLVNDGSGSFTDATATALPAFADPTYQVLLLDADGDGDLDLFAANSAAPSRLYENDGNGHFTDVSGTNLPANPDSLTAATAGDVDGDGDLDLVTFSFENTPNRLLRNDGTGRFAEAPVGFLPPDTGLANYDGDLGDLDGDGDLDLIVVGAVTRVYANDGAGRFSPAAGAAPLDWMFSAYDVDLGDLDTDGDLDAFVSVNGSGPDRLYRNVGAAPSGPRIFHILANHGPTAGGTDVTITGRGFAGATEVRLGDVPLSNLNAVSPTTLTGRTAAAPAGIVDVTVTAASGPVTAPALFEYEDPAAGSLFADASALLPASAGMHSAVLAGDVNGDNLPDLVFLTDGGPHRLFLHEAGASGFRDATATNLPATNTAENNTAQAGALVDVDLDGDLDLVIANDGFVTSGEPGKRNRIYQNDGTGAFADVTSTALPADTDHSNGVACVDLDGDGYPDLVFANDGENRVYRNGGAAAPGTFSEVPATDRPATAVFSRTVTAFDADGDKDLDLVFGEKDSRNHLWLNDGSGKFADVTDGRLPDEFAGGRNDTAAILALDADGDGDSDLLLARSFVDPSLLYRNDGNGTFTEDPDFQDPDPGRRLYGATDALAEDFDGDGKDDLLFTFWIMTPTIRVLPGDGTGGYSVDETLVVSSTSQLSGAAPLDVDGDGDLDVAISANKAILLLENLTK